MDRTELEEKLNRLPDRPGVYLMRDSKGNIIYVGKATSLKNRVRSYFRSTHRQAAKTRALVSHIADLEYIVTDSAVEALILENNLIKEHRPKYNIDLKDDKTYPYLKVTLQEKFPRVMVTRSVQKDGARYFGPYTRAGAMNETLKLLRRLFPVRTCTNHTLQQGRACLNAHIGRCPAPCDGRVDEDTYRAAVGEIVLFLEGRGDDLVARLKQRMEEAAANLEFEKAARLRDQIRAVQDVLAEQKIVSAGLEDQDVIAIARDGGDACGQVFFVRGGKVMGREHFFLGGTADLSREEVMAFFVQQYYARVDVVPREILLGDDAEDREVIEEWLGQKRGGRVRLRVPRRGDKLKLVEMVHKNALMVLQEYQLARRKGEAMTAGALQELRDRLQLPGIPHRIECYDISHIQGSDTVGSMVVFEEGLPKPVDYRRFKIRTVEGPDDFASMKEVLNRRFRRARQELEEGELSLKFAALPDLVIIDGGKGQLSAAREAMRACGVEEILTFGLAKEEELLFREGRSTPIVLPGDSEGLRLLQRIRDEAHRFAVTYHRQLRDRRQHGSVLDEIPGIGPKRKRALLQHFGSVARVKQATLEELISVDGMNEKTARAVHDYLAGIER
ncbi:excinuclease ABC subunit C [Clostridiales bacterium PH28_bin88]|nr:excinuclease ABC subunit C [Clostridiales bacterium PH28_bin88]